MTISKNEARTEGKREAEERWFDHHRLDAYGVAREAMVEGAGSRRRCRGGTGS